MSTENGEPGTAAAALENMHAVTEAHREMIRQAGDLRFLPDLDPEMRAMYVCVKALGKIEHDEDALKRVMEYLTARFKTVWTSDV